MALTGVLTAEAESAYPYLTFETTDGEKYSVSTSALTLSISGTTLTAGSQEFTLSNLSKMYFSETDESVTGIESVTSAPSAQGEGCEYYSLDGRKVENPGKGVYIMKTKQGTFKIVKE